MTEKKQTRSELKRQAIIDAAKLAFQEFGVQSTSMDKLAAMAQVSKRTVYNHFASKEALVMFLVADLWQSSMQQIDVHYEAGAPLEPQLLALVKAEIALISGQNYMELARVAFGHYFYHPEALHKEMAKMAAQETAMTRWLKAAAADGRLKLQDVEFANSQLHNLIKGSCFWPQLVKMAPVLTPEQQQQLAEQSVAMFLSYYHA